MQGPAELQGLLSSLDLRVKPEDDKGKMISGSGPKMTRGNDLRVRQKDNNRKMSGNDREKCIYVKPEDDGGE